MGNYFVLYSEKKMSQPDAGKIWRTSDLFTYHIATHIKYSACLVCWLISVYYVIGIYLRNPGIICRDALLEKYVSAFQRWCNNRTRYSSVWFLVVQLISCLVCFYFRFNLLREMQQNNADNESLIHLPTIDQSSWLLASIDWQIRWLFQQPKHQKSRSKFNFLLSIYIHYFYTWVTSFLWEFNDLIGFVWVSRIRTWLSSWIIDIIVWLLSFICESFGRTVYTIKTLLEYFTSNLLI